MFWLLAQVHATPLPGLARDAWGQKPVLSVTLLGRWPLLQERCGLGPEQMAQLQVLAEDVGQEAESWRRSGDLLLRQGQEPEVLLERAAAAAMSEREAAEAEEIVGDQLPCLMEVLEDGWAEDRLKGGPVFGTHSVTYNVFATQYGANTSDEVAVPDKCIKFANLGWSTCSGGYANPQYQVYLNNGGRTYQVWVGDVGPWNIDDNYWNTPSDGSRPRRLFTDLSQGTNESRAAYYDNYNGGQDQYGRTVLNPAGIDLAPDTAGHIGLAYLQNAWIDVTYLWESYVTYPYLSLGMSQEARSDQPQDSRNGDGLTDVYPGQQWLVDVSVSNSGNEVATNVSLGTWVEAPYLKVIHWQSSDGSGADTPGDTFSIPIGNLDAGATRQLQLTVEAETASAGVDHPDVRVWIAHIDNYYEKADFSAAPSANSYQGWNGGELRAYVEHDVWPLQTAWTWDTDAEGWWAANAVNLSVADGALQLTGAGNDPHSVGPAIQAETDTYASFSWKGAFTGTGPVLLYWATAADPVFSDERMIELPVETGGMAEGTVEPGWTGQLVRLRLDPGPTGDGVLTLAEAALGGKNGEPVDTSEAGDDSATPGGLPGEIVGLSSFEGGCGCAAQGGGGGLTGLLLGMWAMRRRTGVRRSSSAE